MLINGIGFFLILSPLAISGYWILKKKHNPGIVLTWSVIVIFVGIFFIVKDRVTEITLNNIGTLRTVTNQAIADANQINEIKNRIAAQEEIINLVVKEANSARSLIEHISKQTQVVEEQYKVIENTVEEGQKIFQQLKNYSLLTSTYILAGSDDRNSYDKLWGWSQDETCSFKEEALAAVENIMAQTIIILDVIPWAKGVEPDKLPFSTLVEVYKNKSKPITRIALIKYICERADISDFDKMSFLAHVLRNEKSIKVCKQAGGYFAKASGNGYRSLAIANHLEWWDSNKNSLLSK